MKILMLTQLMVKIEVLKSDFDYLGALIIASRDVFYVVSFIHAELLIVRGLSFLTGLIFLVIFVFQDLLWMASMRNYKIHSIFHPSPF